MPRTKKCVKDLDTDKCRKAIKSGRPRCSGKRADCVSDDSGKYCRKSRKPGRPRISKRMYKKPCGTVKPRKKRSDCGKRRKKRSDAGKRRPKKSYTPRKRRSDCGKPRKERSSCKDASIMSMDDYRNFIKVTRNVGSFEKLLKFARGGCDEYPDNYILGAASKVINNSPPPSPSLGNTGASKEHDVVLEALGKAVIQEDGKGGVNNNGSSLLDANNASVLNRVEADEGIYDPVSVNKRGERGAWRESYGASEWIPEEELPSHMRRGGGGVTIGIGGDSNDPLMTADAPRTASAPKGSTPRTASAPKGSAPRIASAPPQPRDLRTLTNDAKADEGIYDPVSVNKRGERGAWRESYGAREWIDEAKLPSHMRRDLYNTPTNDALGYNSWTPPPSAPPQPRDSSAFKTQTEPDTTPTTTRASATRAKIMPSKTADELDDILDSALEEFEEEEKAEARQ